MSKEIKRKRKMKEDLGPVAPDVKQIMKTGTTVSQIVKKRRQKSAIQTSGKSLSKAVTTTQVIDQGDGKTVTIEEKAVEYKRYEQVDKVTLEAEHSYITTMEEYETKTLEESPCSILASNKYLEWRRTNVLKGCHEAVQMCDFDQKPLIEIFRTKPSNFGCGFLARRSWDETIEYGEIMYADEKAHYELTQAKFPGKYPNLELVPKEEFLNDFVSARFIDKLVYCFFDGTVDDHIWPQCTSSIGNIRTVTWGKSQVKIVDDMVFTFPFHDKLPCEIQGFTFRPPSLYFPLDVMRLLPQYKTTYKHELIKQRDIIMGTLDVNPGFQHYLKDKIKSID